MADYETNGQASWPVGWVVSLLGLILLTWFAVLPLGWPEQAVVGVILLAMAFLLHRLSCSHRVTLILMVLSIFCSVRYIYYRVSQTIGAYNTRINWHFPDSVFVLLLVGAEMYALFTLLFGYFQTARPLKRNAVQLPDDASTWPTVDIYIPTYNEPLPVVRPTVLAALNVDWPADKLRVYVLDDGRREEFRAFAAEAGVGYLTREDNRHAKAGNINNALAQTTGEYVALFDSDHVPTRSFLQMTIGGFLKDPALALVQTPHHFYSPDPFERNLNQFGVVPNEGELFYGVVQDGTDLWNATFFCGSCAVLRRAALDDIGGVAVETVTEDAHTALRLHCRGWNSAYLNVPQAAGLATETLAGHIRQRIRWARGMVQILRREFPLFARGLTLPQRLCYLNSSAHFLYALPRLIFLTAPLVYLIFGRVNLYGYWLAIVVYALPHLALANLTNSRISGQHRFSFWNEIYEAVLAPYILLPTLLAFFNPRWGKFNVTAKGGLIGRTYFDAKTARPLVLLLFANLLGLALAAPRYLWWDADQRGTVILNAVWAFYNIIILSAAVAVAWEARQERRHVRIDRSVPVTAMTADGCELGGSILNLSNGGAALQLSSPQPLAAGAPLQLFSPAVDGFRFNASVVGTFGRMVRVRFEELSLHQEEVIAKILYSRADSWLGSDSPTWDRPLRSLGHIALIAMRSLVRLVPGLIQGFMSSSSAANDTKNLGVRPARAHSVHTLIISASLLGLTLSAKEASASRLPAQAAPAPISATAEAPQSEFSNSFDLNALAHKRPLQLSSAENRLVLPFIIPATKVATQVSWSLRYFVPSGYVPDQAALWVFLNGTPIQALPIRPGLSSTVEVELPADLLVTNNQLALQLFLCTGCEGATNENPITVSPGTLRLSGVRLLVADDLKLVATLFLEAGTSRGLTVPFVFAAPPDNATLEAAGVVASWLGSLAEPRYTRFPAAVGSLPQGDFVLFERDGDTVDPALRVEGGTAGMLAMRSNPVDPYGRVLTLAGTDSQAVRNAARYLSTSPALSGAMAAVPGIVTLTSTEAYSAPRWVGAESGNLGANIAPSQWEVTRRRDVDPYARLEPKCENSAQCVRPWRHDVDVYFRLPPDLYFGGTGGVDLTIQYRYSDVGSGSLLVVRLNGVELRRIPLDPDHRIEDIETLVIALPVAQLHFYANHLVFQVSLGTSHAPESTFQLSSANLDLHGLPHYAALPKLELFGEAGFPFTKFPDLSSAAVLVPEQPTQGEIGLYLDAMGFFGAQTGSPATAAIVRRTVDPEELRNRDLLVIGTPSDQPLIGRWTRSMPLLNEVVLHVQPLPGYSVGALWRRYAPLLPWGRQSIEAVLADGVQADGVITGFQSPLAKGRSVIVLALHDGQEAAQGMGTLFQPARESGSVYGTVSILKEGSFRSFDISVARYHEGKLGDVQAAQVFVASHYWLIPLFAFLIAVVLAVGAEDALERRARRRLSLES